MTATTIHEIDWLIHHYDFDWVLDLTAGTPNVGYVYPSINEIDDMISEVRASIDLDVKIANLYQIRRVAEDEFDNAQREQARLEQKIRISGPWSDV